MTGQSIATGHASQTAPDRGTAGHPGQRPRLRINPLAKIAIVLPPMVVLLFVRDVFTPLVFTVLALTAAVAVTRPRPLRFLIGAAVAAMVFTWTVLVFALTTAPQISVGTQVVLEVGPLTVHAGALESGAATVLRVTGLISLTVLGGAGTPGPELAGALVNQLKIPYRYVYPALVALRFVPRLRRDIAIINAAHRIRGVRERRGPLGALTRASHMLIPLMAGTIRHAERISLAMDARGFGAHPTREDRVPTRFTWLDALVMTLGMVAVAGLFWLSAVLGHLELVGTVYPSAVPGNRG
ncbi:energy-coupling factor transporter transmembrane protein EcfT [Nonomuraea mesophila]|uniref:Energy-coupling factor transporter transmembrane protein EcfT n=1 Tax=Nonomuraea mesophila TaxID=2530382 RepID=A0A4R5FSX0_9ACTN|nr:energy-coupling factor transporter transmembrane component T [Nonomuraea mesophila]TDE56529.1 energy-coupling factor transporter transmembrane protein EcfT [Nonomuraea mesophila]